MAKALLGHLDRPNLRSTGEVRRLQQRLRDLESEVARLSALNDELSAELHRRDLDTMPDTMSIVEAEPVLI